MASIVKRGKTYYAQYMIAGKAKRVSLRTTSLQVAKEKVRQIESAQLRQDDLPIPTKTKVGEILAEYVAFMRVHKTERSLRTDCFYLREVFGPVCDELKPPGRQLKRNRQPIEVTYLEDLTTEAFSRFLSRQVQERGLAPKTANRYREVIHTLYNWAINERGVRMPRSVNPISRVRRYKERARDIRFLSLQQIDEQLSSLHEEPLLQTIVAVYIFAGLRREELTWLRLEDVDLKAGRNGVIRIRGKSDGEKSWQPKTKVNRVVPMSSALRKHLDRYQPRIVPGHWYFPSPEGFRWDADNLSHALRHANKSSRLPWTCLDYRHTFGSHLAMKGESLYKISTLMGNSPEICRRHYAMLVPESLENVVEFDTSSDMIEIN